MERYTPTLTFSQLVLEVWVAPSLPVEINTVTDKKRRSDSCSYRTRPAAHHIFKQPTTQSTELKQDLFSSTRSLFDFVHDPQIDEEKKDPGAVCASYDVTAKLSVLVPV